MILEIFFPKQKFRFIEKERVFMCYKVVIHMLQYNFMKIDIKISIFRKGITKIKKSRYGIVNPGLKNLKKQKILCGLVCFEARS
jgi:hypothetical protein